MSGYIYCLSNESFKDNIYKVGYTTRNLKNRLNELYNTSIPTPFKVEFAKYVDNASDSEKLIHKYLTDYRVNNKREYFKIELNKIHTLFELCLSGSFITDEPSNEIEYESDYESDNENESDIENESDNENENENNEINNGTIIELDNVIQNKNKIKTRRIYKCDKCSKYFGKKCNLIAHLNKKFSCISNDLKVFTISK